MVPYKCCTRFRLDRPPAQRCRLLGQVWHAVLHRTCSGREACWSTVCPNRTKRGHSK